MKNLKYITLGIIATLAIVLDGSAQQDPMYTQYFFNPLTVNSGYAGSRDVLNATLLVREQWIGKSVEGRPRTQTLSLHSPLRNKALAIGGTIIRDEVGPTNSTSVFGDFAYRFQVSDNSKLALGIKAGVNLLTANLSELSDVDPADVGIAQNIKNSPLPNFGGSAYWYSEKHFLGLSVPKLMENKLDQQMTDVVGEERMHLFFMGGYVFKLSPFLKFKPTFLTKVVKDTPLSVDLTANFLIDDKLWLGGMYRIGDAAGLLASYQITDQLRTGVSYDYTLSELQTYNNGSLELMLSYDFFFKGDKQLSPRYF